MAGEIGTNIRIVDKEDRILIVIAKDAKLQKSKTGSSKILAKTDRFQNIGTVSGAQFKNSELGLNLMLTVRPKKAVKNKKPRLDDDDGDD